MNAGKAQKKRNPLNFVKLVVDQRFSRRNIKIR